MAENEHRRFEDVHGDGWEIRPREDYRWDFIPVEDDDRVRTIVTPPPEVDDPSELDVRELRKLLDSGIPTRGISESFPSPGES